MGYLYFDESIQEQGRFIVGAFVYSDQELSPSVDAAIAEVGLVPKVDEYKSNAKMQGNPQAQKLRAAIYGLLRDTRIVPEPTGSAIGIDRQGRHRQSNCPTGKAVVAPVSAINCCPSKLPIRFRAAFRSMSIWSLMEANRCVACQLKHNFSA